MGDQRLLTIFAAGEIPSAMVTFVSLLMFVQLGVSGEWAVFMSSMLFVPWVLKSFLFGRVRAMGHYGRWLHVSESLLCVSLFGLSASFRLGVHCVFAMLMAVGLLCSWHELLARMYYESVFHPTQRRYYDYPRMVSSQLVVAFTYGAFILVVGGMEVFFRQIPRAWAMGCYLMAGVFLLTTLYHFASLRRVVVHRVSDSSFAVAGNAVSGAASLLCRPYRLLAVLTLFALLLPQGLMFHTRVLFLLDSRDAGGLGCTIQEIGFAQGTVGVLAFCIGIAFGYWLVSSVCIRRVFWHLVVALGFSPVVYLLMSYFPPQSLAWLCACTCAAQLTFGLGLSACGVLVDNLSGGRSLSTVNLLHVPAIALCMLPAMAVSGALAYGLGYGTYFLVAALMAPLSWVVAFLAKDRILS